MTKTRRYLGAGGCRVALWIGVALVLTGCESEEDKERESIFRYAAQTAEYCRQASERLRMVEAASVTGSKPKVDEAQRSWTKTVCRESVKAQRMKIEQLSKDVGAKH